MMDFEEFYQFMLEKRVNLNKEFLEKAYFFGKNHHHGQKRMSGEDYFIHPIEVAKIVADIIPDEASIVTALIHDTVEDTEATIEEVIREFGEEIGHMVDAVTKLDKIDDKAVSVKTIDNFCKLVMAVSKDLRVLIVKLADRLHNMQTLQYIKPEKRIKKSKETLMIYAPLAESIGMHRICNQLQDLAFLHLNPETKKQIEEKLNSIIERKQETIDSIIDELQDLMKKHGVDAEVSGRIKSPYSIWKKMQEKNTSDFHKLYDIMAFRIITKEVEDCYRIFGIINYNYQMIPGKFKDYISVPKDNGYQSLHTVVLGPMKKKIEIQIRTDKMHQEAEIGFAAHWQYKSKYNVSALNNVQYKMIRELTSMIENREDTENLIQSYKIDFHADKVFCFTPTGDVFQLPVGSTILDFAYILHSDIGNKCSSAKINGNLSPLYTVINNGDQVEIITSDNITPTLNWERFVTTQRAKTAIRHFIKKQKDEEYLSLGKAMVKKFFSARNLVINDKIITESLSKFYKGDLKSLYIDVGNGKIKKEAILNVVYPEVSKESELTKDGNKHDGQFKRDKESSSDVLGVVSGMPVNYAKCCHPIPGDIIIGVINIGDGVSIHRKDCGNVKNYSYDSDYILDVQWKDDMLRASKIYSVRIGAVLNDRIGTLAKFTKILADKEININKIKTLDSVTNYFELLIDISVSDLNSLEELIAELKILKDVYSINRV